MTERSRLEWRDEALRRKGYVPGTPCDRCGRLEDVKEHLSCPACREDIPLCEACAAHHAHELAEDEEYQRQLAEKLERQKHYAYQPSDHGDFDTPMGGCVECEVEPPGVCPKYPFCWLCHKDMRGATLVNDGRKVWYCPECGAKADRQVPEESVAEDEEEADLSGWLESVDVSVRQVAKLAFEAGRRLGSEGVSVTGYSAFDEWWDGWR